ASSGNVPGEIHGHRHHREGEDRRRLPAYGQRHRFARGSGRAAHRAHRRSHRALQDARERPSLAPRAAQDGEPAPQAARLPERDESRQLPRTGRETGSARLKRTSRNPQANLAGFLLLHRSKGNQVFEIAKRTFQWGANTVTIETGEIARQASGAAVVTMDDTVILATVVGAPTARPGQDFFPLTVDYTEKFYAAGRIPGGFFKREGRPTEREILVSRLIDRPIRPLFP